MAFSGELSRRVEKVVGYPPLCDKSKEQRREFHEAYSTPPPSKSCRASGKRRSCKLSRTGPASAWLRATSATGSTGELSKTVALQGARFLSPVLAV